MNRNSIPALAALALALAAAPALAEHKGAPHGNGKPDAGESRGAHGDCGDEYHPCRDGEGDGDGKGKGDDARGQDKQPGKHTVRHEEGKGSAQGQAQREEHSRKWWKFWE